MEKTYTDSLYYQLRLTAKYLKVFGIQLFKKLNINLDFEEIVVLDLLSRNKNICLRDVAKILLKDRANTGRLANNLERKGLITINVSKKSNRLVKILELTKTGKELFTESVLKIEPMINEMCNKIFDENEEKKINNLLTEFRRKLSSVMEIHI